MVNKNQLIITLFFLVTSAIVIAQPTTETKRNGAYDRELIATREVLPYDHIREGDVFWEKRVWRVIDFREKMNLPFTWPKDPFMEFLYEEVMKGEITAFAPLDEGNFSEGTAYTVEDLTLKFNRIDTQLVYNEETYEEEVKLIPNIFDPNTVTKIKIKEDWVFDEETSQLVVRIIGLAPVRLRIDPNTGEPIGEEDMFWVYYPDLREFNVRHEIFNDKNSARFLTYDDIFEMRFFSSYIIKEDNVYDRFIQSYSAGIDMVLESDRIKNEIFEFEHTLWEF